MFLYQTGKNKVSLNRVKSFITYIISEVESKIRGPILKLLLTYCKIIYYEGLYYRVLVSECVDSITALKYKVPSSHSTHIQLFFIEL